MSDLALPTPRPTVRAWLARGLRASLSSENDWGQELLGPQGLPPGGRIQLSFAKGQACSIDVRAEFGANTQALERMQVQTCTINEYALK